MTGASTIGAIASIDIDPGGGAGGRDPEREPWPAAASER